MEIKKEKTELGHENSLRAGHWFVVENERVHFCDCVPLLDGGREARDGRVDKCLDADNILAHVGCHSVLLWELGVGEQRKGREAKAKANRVCAFVVAEPQR